MPHTPHKPSDIRRDGLTKIAKLRRDEAPSPVNCKAMVQSPGMNFYRERRCQNKVLPPQEFCHVHRKLVDVKF